VTTARRLLDAAGVDSAIRRMAEDLAALGRSDSLALVGIRSRGVPIAERLAVRPGEAPLPIGVLDITLYRDDFQERGDWPEVRESAIPFPVAGRTIVLVDDVLFTGRTIRAAMNALMDYGRPRAVRLAVLVDRGHRELPVQADVVGARLETRREERVRVHLREVDGADEVLVEGAGG